MKSIFHLTLNMLQFTAAVIKVEGAAPYGGTKLI